MLTLLKRHRELIIVGALLLYPFAAYLASGHKGRELNWVDRAVLNIASPLESGLSWVCDGIGGGISRYLLLRGTRERNDQLLLENSQCRAEVNALTEVVAENQRLKQQLGYAEASPGQKIGARIFGVNPSSSFLSLRPAVCFRFTGRALGSSRATG